MDSRSKGAAEGRFQKAQRAQEVSKTAWSHYESEARATDARTALLRQERLAREAADLAGAAAKKPRAAKKPAARKGVGSY